MNRKKGIYVSLFLALIFIGAIFIASQKRYVSATKEVDVVMVDRFIPVGQAIVDQDLTVVKVPEKIAADFVKNKADIIGKASSVSLIKGQYIWSSSIDEGKPQTHGMVTVFIPVDLSSSCGSVAGDRVNIHFVDKQNMAVAAREPIYKGALVRYSRDQANNEISPAGMSKMTEVASGGGKVPVVIGVEVPPEIANVIVDPAAKKALYLTRSEIKG